jgi:hypothetical protein
MKSVFLLLSTTLLFGLAATAQPYQGTVSYDKQSVACYIINLPYNQSTTEDAIKNKFKSMGVKANNRKGFTEYNAIVVPEFGSSPIDAKFKIEKQSGNKDGSTVYMIANPTGTGVGTIPDFGPGSVNFLNSLTTTTSDYDLEQQIKNQEDEVKKAEKRSNNLIDDAKDMQRRLQKLQEDIADNQRKQAEQVTEVQKQRDLLTQLVNRRRTRI